MKEQAYFSEKVVQLMASKTWDQLSAAEEAMVLQELDQATYENYRCMIGVSRALHQETPAPAPAIKERLLTHMQQRKIQNRKKAFWEEWFQFQVPVWQVSLASLAFVLLYLSGVPGDTMGSGAAGPDQPLFQGPVDTVYLDMEQAPEDSSDQRQPLLESNLYQYLPSFMRPNATMEAPSPDRSRLAKTLPVKSEHQLPPTDALLSSRDLLPTELLEIQS